MRRQYSICQIVSYIVDAGTGTTCINEFTPCLTKTTSKATDTQPLGCLSSKSRCLDSSTTNRPASFSGSMGLLASVPSSTRAPPLHWLMHISVLWRVKSPRHEPGRHDQLCHQERLRLLFRAHSGGYDAGILNTKRPTARGVEPKCFVLRVLPPACTIDVGVDGNLKGHVWLITV